MRAEDAGHALASLGNRHFDCILLDYSLPDIDGVTLLKQIRAELPLTPVVMLTGQTWDDIAAAALNAGASNYINKSDVSDTRLHEVITAAIEQCEARQAETKPQLPFLLIDDNADDRETYIRLLQQTRYQSARCVEAATAEEGLRYLGGEKFEAILLDYLMPGMDGLDVLTRIRASNPFVPVIFMTGQGDVAVAVLALQSGASDYLVKSAVDAQMLHETVNASNSQRRRCSPGCRVSGHGRGTASERRTLPRASSEQNHRSIVLARCRGQHRDLECRSRTDQGIHRS